MNEKRIEQVMQIEKQAQQILEQAKRAAGDLPARAEAEAQAIVEQARTEAQVKAHELIAAASAQDETARILAEVDQKNRTLEEKARKNLDRAVAYVVDGVLGRA